MKIWTVGHSTHPAEKFNEILHAEGKLVPKYTCVKTQDLKDKGDWVFPGAGIGALAGGTLFGVGMTLAGGCGAGSIWRAGEGQVKLWAALAMFALGASLARLALVQAVRVEEHRALHPFEVVRVGEPPREHPEERAESEDGEADQHRGRETRPAAGGGAQAAPSFATG